MTLHELAKRSLKEPGIYRELVEINIAAASNVPAVDFNTKHDHRCPDERHGCEPFPSHLGERRMVCEV